MFNTTSSYILCMGELMCAKYHEGNHSIFLEWRRHCSTTVAVFQSHDQVKSFRCGAVVSEITTDSRTIHEPVCVTLCVGSVHVIYWLGVPRFHVAMWTMLVTHCRVVCLLRKNLQVLYTKPNPAMTAKIVSNCCLMKWNCFSYTLM